jgi:hypothetical protein
MKEWLPTFFKVVFGYATVRVMLASTLPALLRNKKLINLLGWLLLDGYWWVP